MLQKEQHFYSLIGRISIAFSNLESQIIEIIGLLIKSDDDFITSLLLSENNISQNLKLLLKLNKYRYSQRENIKTLHDSIDNLRLTRNLFIHGAWSIQDNIQGELIFICEEKRIQFTKGAYGISSRLNKFTEFRIEDFEIKLKEIEKCSNIAYTIIKGIEEEGIT